MRASQAPETLPVRPLSEPEAESFRQAVCTAYGPASYALVLKLKHTHTKESYPEEEAWLYHFTSPQGERCWRLYFPDTGYQYWLKDTLEAWAYEGHTAFKLERASVFKPVGPRTNYSLYDLSFLCIHWPAAEYLSSMRLLGRKAHVFRLSPPAQVSEYLGPLQVFLDAHFFSLLKAEWLTPNNLDKLRSLKVLSFQKTQENVWIAKRLELIDHAQHSKTELNIVFCTFHPVLDGLYCTQPEDLARIPPHPSTHTLL